MFIDNYSIKMCSITFYALKLCTFFLVIISMCRKIAKIVYLFSSNKYYTNDTFEDKNNNFLAILGLKCEKNYKQSEHFFHQY